MRNVIGYRFGLFEVMNDNPSGLSTAGGIVTKAVLACSRCGHTISNSGGPGIQVLCLDCWEKFQLFMKGPEAIKESILGIPLIDNMYVVQSGPDKFHSGTGASVTPKLYKKGHAMTAEKRGYGKVVPVVVMEKPTISNK